MMQIPLGKKMTNFKCKPPENRLNLPGRGSVKQSSKMQAYRAYGAAHFYVQERCRHFRRGYDTFPVIQSADAPQYSASPGF